MIELGHHAPHVRLNYGLHLLAMGGDHETEPWAYSRKTLYSTNEWIQRYMARAAETKWEVKRPARVVLSPAEQDEAEEEFRIWTAEKAALRRVEVLAERDKRHREWHLRRERRRRESAKDEGEEAAALAKDAEAAKLHRAERMGAQERLYRENTWWILRERARRGGERNVPGYTHPKLRAPVVPPVVETPVVPEEKTLAFWPCWTCGTLLEPGKIDCGCNPKLVRALAEAIVKAKPPSY